MVEHICALIWPRISLYIVVYHLWRSTKSIFSVYSRSAKSQIHKFGHKLLDKKFLNFFYYSLGNVVRNACMPFERYRYVSCDGGPRYVASTPKKLSILSEMYKFFSFQMARKIKSENKKLWIFFTASRTFSNDFPHVLKYLARLQPFQLALFNKRSKKTYFIEKETNPLHSKSILKIWPLALRAQIGQ